MTGGIPVRWIGGQHVREDLGFIPSFADWVKAIRPEAWMGRALRIEKRCPLRPGSNVGRLKGQNEREETKPCQI